MKISRSLIAGCALLAWLGFAQTPSTDATPPAGAAKSDGSSSSPTPAAGDPAVTAGQGTAAQQRTQLNLLGQTDTQSGESRRNENNQFNLIDTNTVRELNVRLGATATLVDKFEADRSYLGSEYGRRATPPMHLPHAPGSGLHGALWETHGNSLFSARAFFQVGKVRPARENDYGFRLGTKLFGPVYATFEGGQQRTSGFVNGNVLVPLPGERTPLTTDPFLRALVARWLAAYPNELPNRTDIDQRALNTNAAQRLKTNTLGSRIDSPAGKSTRLAVRYQFTSQQVDAFQLVAGQNPDTDTHNHTATITATRAITPSLVLNISSAFERITTLIRPEPNAVGQTVSASNVIAGLGPSPPIPIVRAQNRFRQGVAVQKTASAHRVTFGGDILRTQVNGREQDGERGIITFGNDFGRTALENFLLGAASQFTQSLGNTHRGYRALQTFLFAGDHWRVSQNLDLSLGVRYEPFSQPAEVNSIDVIPFPCDCNNWAPRAGFAYRLPKEQGTLRAAYGLHYGEIFATTYGQVRMSPPGSYRVVVGQPDLRNPLGGLTLSTLPANFRAGVFEVSSGMVSPYAHQYTFLWERELPAGMRMQAGYAGSRAHKLFQMWFNNRARVVPGIPQTSGTINQRRADANLLEVFLLHNASRAYFDSGRATIILPRKRGLNLDISYWFSKSLDIGNDYTATLSGVDARQGRSQSESNVHGDLKGPSQFDQPHALLLRGSYETAKAGSGNRVLGALFKEWNLSGVWLLKNGTPFTVESGSDGPGFGNVDGQGSDRPHVLDPSVLGRTIGNPDTSVALLPRSAFAYIAPTEDRGNLGRNTFRRGKIANVNASLERTFRLASEWKLQFRAESINFLNTPQFAEPNFNVVSPSFGRITNTLNDGRTFRFRLRLEF